jgi:hypothetical protein
MIASGTSKPYFPLFIDGGNCLAGFFFMFGRTSRARRLGLINALISEKCPERESKKSFIPFVEQYSNLTTSRRPNISLFVSAPLIVKS